MIDAQLIQSLPKIELHDHLDGGLRTATIVELSAQIGHELPTTDPAELKQWFYDAANSGDLPTYLKMFDHTTAVMQTAEAIARIAKEAVEDLAADNVCYAELRFAPEQHQERGLELQDIVDAAVRGVKEGERAVAAQGKRAHARLILCAMRQADRSTEIAQLTIDNFGPDSPGEGYVVGFDIAGPEDGFPPTKHEAAFDLLRKNLVPFTIHAGEAAGVESLQEAVALGASRIGHGVRVYEDFDATMSGVVPGKVAAAIRDRRIPLEICPTSNTQTGVCETIADHPFGFLYETGFVCTINTDNRLVSGTSLSREFTVLAEDADLELWQMLEMTTNSLQVAFCDAPLREDLEREVIYPAYMAAQGRFADDEQTAEHPARPETAGAGENLELSMENLKAELEELGLDLDAEAPESPDDRGDSARG
ncbi:adenosine deaminase [Corynebacterium heidelbergense]|uniref:adenosine deaminase n=1 Tax=Corynebacterium heidelbergense TaxID=2055947 RepID=A0A364VDU4_9CORY|nr:adenosine deaminase [Corynebacterium heidelbergense]RAV34791.1 adenosine deaminase [Corynebacterium heidelbergense]WCZ37244.1 Aminodeoxyfutalosine deaminase [Corynebacterium heidelbergense]